MISFDPTHAYTDGEVAELTRNQRRKYNKHMELVRVEQEVVAPQTRAEPDEEVLESGNDGNGSDEEVGRSSVEDVEEKGEDDEMDVDSKEASRICRLLAVARVGTNFVTFLIQADDF